MRAQEVAYRFSLLVVRAPRRRGRRDAGRAAQDLSTRQPHRSTRGVPDLAVYDGAQRCLMKRRRRAGEPAHVRVDRAAALDRSDGEGARSTSPTDAPVDEQVDRRMDGQPAARGAQEAAAGVPHDRRDAGDGRACRRERSRAITGYSEANVKTRLHRARLMLRRTPGERMTPPSAVEYLRRFRRTWTAIWRRMCELIQAHCRTAPGAEKSSRDCAKQRAYAAGGLGAGSGGCSPARAGTRAAAARRPLIR